MFDVERIKYQAETRPDRFFLKLDKTKPSAVQVTNGKNAMPAFGERLGPEDIEELPRGGSS